MRWWQQLGAFVLAGASVLSWTRPAVQVSGIDQVRWLAGCWEMQRGTRTAFEMWMPPAGGLMLGASRTVSAGQVVEFERVQLVEREGKLVYTALPSGQAEASFTSVAVSDEGFTVENLQHDFPQRIIYRRVGADSLVARIEGPARDGTRGVDFPMKRTGCEAR